MPDESTSPPLSVAILGTDAVLAAAPATPVQLAHACLAAGFAAVVPASWGDELIATECLRRVTARGREPVVCAVCPRVTERLLASGGELAQFAVALVSPPVATARYLRAMCGEDRVRITFIGACPGADDESIDDRVMPGEFLAQLAGRGVDLLEQPQVFDSVIPPDRRRFQSLPGGVPTPEALWGAGGRTLIEIDDDDYVTELAQRLISRENALLDIAPKLGCACSGALPDVAPRGARIAAAAVEPPRSAMPVVDTTVQVDLVRSLPAASRRREVAVPPPVESSPPMPAPPARHAPPRETPVTRSIPQAPPPRRRVSTPEGMAAIDPAAPRRRGGASSAPARTVAGSVPTVNSGEGRALPRAYVARRRTGRTPPDNEAIRPGAARPAGAERERPIEASVEPARPIVAPQRSARPVADRAEAVSAMARATIDRLVREPLRLAVLIGAVIIASMLLGVMAGRLFLGAAAETPPSAEAVQGDTLSGARTLIGGSPASRTVERGGAVGPELAPRSSTTRRGSAPATPRRSVPDEAGARTAGQPAAPAPSLPATEQERAAADSGARQPARPAAPAAAATRQDSIDRELRAIARELELRRARLDSIARRESLGRRPIR